MQSLCLLPLLTFVYCLLGLLDCGDGFLVKNMVHRKILRNKRLKASFDCDVVRNTQIFCNVELTGASIQAVGFDMDYTLAQYNKEFDLLAFEGAKRKLYENFNYPKDVLDFKYCSEKFRRGLIIDQNTGNILKIDRHKYPRVVLHGLNVLSSKERKDLYTNKMITFTESNYVNIDTLFMIIDAVLFMHMVDLKDNNPDLIPQSYAQVYSDIRACVESCHKDGTIKATVMKNPGKYIIDDPDTVPMLQQLQQAGKKVFLLTNSLMDYTHVVMDYIVHGSGKYADLDWRDLFDVIIVGACKPAFLMSESLSIFRVDSNQNLHNIEDKSVLPSLLLDPSTSSTASSSATADDDSPVLLTRSAPPTLLSRTIKPSRSTKKKDAAGSRSPQLSLVGRGNTFQGGSWRDLHDLLGISVGHEILYVGDHMFSDILRSKKTLGWRTCLIIPELDSELEVAEREYELACEIERLRILQLQGDDLRDALIKRMRQGEDLTKELADAIREAEEAKKNIALVGARYNRKFNEFWGQLFKSGHQDSRFARQIMDYACLYTSRASNFVYVDPNRAFRAGTDYMPHERKPSILMDPSELGA